MAYAAVASLLQTVDILLDHHQLSISPQFKDQIVSIHQHTCSLRSFIEASSARVNNWEETIREVTNRAEDIIELLLSDTLLKSIVGSSESESEKKKYKALYSLDELEKVAEEIESIANRVKGARRIEAPVGSEEELMEVISLLRGGSSSLETIAICGGGGMGKTTLAGDAYNHPLTVEHFDVRAGSIVTREYTLVRVIEDLLRCMKAEFRIPNSEDESLLPLLGSRRYLIVLFDVWSKDVLERLKMMLPDCGNGSRIIFTTRSSELASSAHHVHEMRLLDDDTAWNLLREKLFEGDPCPFQLEPMGKAIAISCGGHPLSIEVVSGILGDNETEAAWEDVSENIKIASQDAGDKLYEILYLGYVYLPHRLRPCFSFLGIYPQGRAIYVSRLVKLWVAEGFVNENGCKSLEETGEEYVEDLVARSLVSVSRRKSNGRIKSITIHDLVRGMCLRQAHRDNFNLHYDMDYRCAPGVELQEIIKSCRRVSNLNGSEHFLTNAYGSTIRTLVMHSEAEHSIVDLRCWMGNVRLLRILSLSTVYGYHLSSEVFELFHLRYLALYREINIPEAISNLGNLQTLIICHEKIDGVFDTLPQGIWRMPQLRHLYIISFKFPNMKGTSSALESLHKLSRIVDFVCSRENLKTIPNVKNLALLYTSNFGDVAEDYKLHNLIYLQKLEVLKIKTNLSIGKEHEMRFATFPQTLKKLSLRGLQLSWEDMKTVASLPNLEVLKLRNYACAGKTWETSEGGFSRLLFLLIEESNLKNWITKSSHFPRLWRLVLVRCSSLLEVPYEMVEVATLQLIHLDDANLSLWRSAERIRQDRRRSGLDPLVVYVD